MIAARHASAIALPALAALFLAVLTPSESRAAADRSLRQVEAAIHDMFAPPRRARRAKAKQESTVPKVESPAARSDVRATARDKAIALGQNASLAAREVRAVPRGRAEEAKAKAQRLANLPPAREATPQAARAPQAHREPPVREAPPTPRAAQPPETLPAKPRGHPAGRTAALPPAAAEPEPDVKPSDKAEPQPNEQGEPAPPSACQLRLTEDHAAIKLLPPIKTEQCAVDDLVRLEGVTAKDGRRIAVNPPATLRCPMAEAVVHWVRDELVPAAPDFGAQLKALTVDTSFECRPRNHVKGAKLSEHGHANAIDVRAITLTNGKAVTLTDTAVDKAARERLKAGACARFSTVLGPGSDGYHESHVHLDLIERRGRYRMCQWDVRDVADVVPMPRERPPEAPPRTASSGKTSARN